MPWTLKIVLCALIYIGVAQLGFALDLVDGAVSSIWAPTGFALALLFLGGRSLFPAILLGEFAANVLHGAGAGTSLVFGMGDMLEALASCEILLRLGVQARLERPRDVLALLLPAALLPTLIAATFGTGALLAAHSVTWSGAWLTWHTWWLGDAAGIITVTPLILTFSSHGFGWPQGRSRLEFTAFLAALAPVAWTATGHTPEVALLALPVLSWGALRFGQRGAALANAVVAAAGIGLISSHSELSGVPLVNRLLLAQDFLLVVAVTMLLLAAVLSDREQALEELRGHATRDHLTGLANRRVFHERLATEMVRCHRYRRPIALAMVDIDNFKLVNDGHGHLAGDTLLASVAMQISSVMRADALVARLGGDEFAVMMPECDAQYARMAVERARVAVGGLVLAGGLRATISAGVADSARANPPALLMAHADAALYAAKADGRDRCALYAPSEGPLPDGETASAVRAVPGRPPLPGVAEV